jgi:hypothetical protein
VEVDRPLRLRPEPPTRIPESQFQTFDIPAPTIYAWPKDWAVVGKPAAFWTNTEVSYIDMTLLTYAVTVKVTPEKFHWDFGDEHWQDHLVERGETAARRQPHRSDTNTRSPGRSRCR